jgi:hypothetical protein
MLDLADSFRQAGIHLVVFAPMVAACVDLFRRRLALWKRVGWLLIMSFVIPMGALIYWLVRYAVWTLEIEVLDLAEGNVAR